MKETIVLFGKTQSLVGIVAEPQAAPNNNLPAVILLNAGLMHRVGPNRLYVKLARALAMSGFVVLRFDFSGMGDSEARKDHLLLEKSVVDDTQEAMNYLAQTKGFEQFLLIGHCSGAGISFFTASQDPRVIGATLINPQGAGEEWATYDRNQKLAQYYTHYYSKAALGDVQRWARFVKGDVDYRSIARNVLQNILWGRITALSFRLKKALGQGKEAEIQLSEQKFNPAQELHHLVERGMQILFVYSEGNSGLEYIHTIFGQELAAGLAAHKIKIEIIPESDHLFTLLAGQKKVVETIQIWTQAIARNLKQGDPIPAVEGYKE
jgi:dienelactone hydrolase